MRCLVKDVDRLWLPACFHSGLIIPLIKQLYWLPTSYEAVFKLNKFRNVFVFTLKTLRDILKYSADTPMWLIFEQHFMQYSIV